VYAILRRELREDVAGLSYRDRIRAMDDFDADLADRAPIDAADVLHL
jgi:hypothetical protein